MAARRIPKPVPKFTPYTIALAHCCALELWNGNDFKSGKPLKVSDFEFIKTFAIPTHSMLHNPNQNPPPFDEDDIKDLIQVAKMTLVNLAQPPNDLLHAISQYKPHPFDIYKNMKNGTLKLKKYDYPTHAILAWSDKFVSPQNNGQRMTVACRSLFFALPGMYLFNYSRKISYDYLNLTANPINAIKTFNHSMYTGLLRNRTLLNKLPAPFSTHSTVAAPVNNKILDEVFREMLNAQWWQRRVMDIAMLIHHNPTMIKRKVLQNQANAILSQTLNRKPKVKLI